MHEPTPDSEVDDNRKKGSITLRKFLAIIQLMLVLGLIGFSTYHLFTGNFYAAMSAFPVVVVLYLLLNARKRHHTG